MLVRILFVSVLSLFVLISCGKSGLDFVVQFDEVNGLSSKSVVVYDSQPVGNVEKIEYLDSGKFDVYVHLDNQYEHLATRNAEFYIDQFQAISGNQPQTNASSPAIYVLPVKGETQMIQAGEHVQGSSRFTAYTNKLKQNVDDTLNAMKRAFDDVVDDISQSGVEKQVDTLETEVDQLIDNIDSFNQQTRQMIKQELIPELREQTERLREKLDEIEVERALETVDKKLSELADSLK